MNLSFSLPRTFAVACLVWASACGSETSPNTDAGTIDATIDLGTSLPDSGLPRPDSGTSAPDAGQPPRFSSAQIEQVRQLAQNYVGTQPGGLAVGVRSRGDDVLMEGFGKANASDDVETGTVFEVGSVTKQFTAFIVLQLVEAGKISLDENIRTYLQNYPESKTADGQSHSITVSQLIAHTSGLPNYTANRDFLNPGWQRPWTSAELLALFQDMPLEFAPGSNWAYSNSGYFLLGLIIEEVTQKSYAEVLDEALFGPLMLSQSSFCDTDTRSIPRAQGYLQGQEIASTHMSQPNAAGAICMTVKDSLDWIDSLHQGEVVSGAVDSSFPLSSGLSSFYGYGLGIGRIDWRDTVGHGGNIAGFSAQSSYYPQEELSIVLLTNRNGAELVALQAAITRALLGEYMHTPPMMTLNATTAAALTGNYAGPGGGGLRIEYQEATGLQMRPPGALVPTPMQQLSDDDFSVQGSGLPIRFVKDAPARLQIETNGFIIEFVRQ